jgi:hypothetical protein
MSALENLPPRAEPIVIGNHHVFMELSYYAPKPTRERLLFPISRDLELRYRGYDSAALIMRVIRHSTKLHIEEYDALLARRQPFVLAANSSEYLPKVLAAAGYRLSVIVRRTGAVVYEVQPPS